MQPEKKVEEVVDGSKQKEIIDEMRKQAAALASQKPVAVSQPVEEVGEDFLDDLI